MLFQFLIVSNLKRKIAGGDSHPTTRNDLVWIVEAYNDLTADGKQSVDTGCISAGSYVNVKDGSDKEDQFEFDKFCVILGFDGVQTRVKTIHLYETAIKLSVMQPHSNITFYVIAHYIRSESDQTESILDLSGLNFE
ncbi:MAG: hypothetical protein EZS28_002987 [Streblomastix strix]|uniref:Uncharacterized protein n=1 Tax=Streblomastix strix TaxID=222440 RepID=A0A5J4X2P9_9EUKA|nr:MAG: hypothetical protein EZS28_002987 [Streblomastix strix]